MSNWAYTIMTQRQAAGSYESIVPNPRPKRKHPPWPGISSSGLRFAWYLERSWGTSRASNAPTMDKMPYYFDPMKTMIDPPCSCGHPALVYPSANELPMYTRCG